jgi:hypothetical protein
MSTSKWPDRLPQSDASLPVNYAGRIKTWVSKWGDIPSHVAKLEVSDALNAFHEQFQPQYNPLPPMTTWKDVGYGEIGLRALVNFFIMVWYAFLIIALIMAAVNMSRLGWTKFWQGAPAVLAAAPAQLAAAASPAAKKNFYGLPYSTLPNGIPMTGSGDAMANAAASFYGDDAMIATGYDDEQRFYGADDPAVAFADDPAVAFADDPAVAFADDPAVAFADGGISPSAADSQLIYGTLPGLACFLFFMVVPDTTASAKVWYWLSSRKVP